MSKIDEAGMANDSMVIAVVISILPRALFIASILEMLSMYRFNATTGSRPGIVSLLHVISTHGAVFGLGYIESITTVDGTLIGFDAPG